MARKNPMISKKALQEEDTSKQDLIETFVKTGDVDTSKPRETKKLMVSLDEDVHTRLKMRASQDRTTMTKIVEALILQFLDD